MAERTILVTGSSTGIGYHCAHALKGRGWRVFAACRQQRDCERIAGEGLETVQLDYTDPLSLHRATDTVLEATGGRLDALFNNGAYAMPGAAEDFSYEALEAIVGVEYVEIEVFKRGDGPADELSSKIELERNQLATIRPQDGGVVAINVQGGY